MASKNKSVKIEFTKREVTGTGACRKIRAKNMVPVILYGPEHKDGLAGLVPVKAITSLADSPRRETTLVELAMADGTTVSSLVRDVQRHPLTQRVNHIDFYQVLKGHKVKVEIPVRILNKETCKGVKDGGIINLGTRLVHVLVQPSDIPDEIDVDVKGLEIGAEVFVKDLPMPESAEILTECDALVVHVTMPKAEDESEAEEEREVEVLAKGKACKAE